MRWNRALIEQEVAGLLVGMGVRAERLCSDARLLQDLRIDGDDAAGFFDAVSAAMGAVAVCLVGQSSGTRKHHPIRLSNVVDAIERGSWDAAARTGDRGRA